MTRGYSRIPHNFFKWLCLRNDFTGLDIRVLLFIVRKTIGWNKVSDAISYSQIGQGVGCARRSAIRSVNRLVKDGSLSIVGKFGNGVNKYQVVTNGSPLLVTEMVSHSDRPVTSSQVQTGDQRVTHKRNKETIQKDFSTNDGLRLDPTTGLMTKA